MPDSYSALYLGVHPSSMKAKESHFRLFCAFNLKPRQAEMHQNGCGVEVAFIACRYYRRLGEGGAKGRWEVGRCKKKDRWRGDKLLGTCSTHHVAD